MSRIHEQSTTHRATRDKRISLALPVMPEAPASPPDTKADIRLPNQGMADHVPIPTVESKDWLVNGQLVRTAEELAADLQQLEAMCPDIDSMAIEGMFSPSIKLEEGERPKVYIDLTTPDVEMSQDDRKPVAINNHVSNTAAGASPTPSWAVGSIDPEDMAVSGMSPTPSWAAASLAPPETTVSGASPTPSWARGLFSPEAGTPRAARDTQSPSSSSHPVTTISDLKELPIPVVIRPVDDFTNTSDRHVSDLVQLITNTVETNGMRADPADSERNRIVDLAWECQNEDASADDWKALARVLELASNGHPTVVFNPLGHDTMKIGWHAVGSAAVVGEYAIYAENSGHIYRDSTVAPVALDSARDYESRVDFVLTAVPHVGHQLRTHIENAMQTTSGALSFGPMNYLPIAFIPVPVAIVTQAVGSQDDCAMVRLGLWAAATFCKMTIIGSQAPPLTYLTIKVDGHDWDLYFASYHEEQAISAIPNLLCHQG